jgi:hypothetical protein
MVKETHVIFLKHTLLCSKRKKSRNFKLHVVRNLLEESGREVYLSPCHERETNPCWYKISMARVQL